MPANIIQIWDSLGRVTPFAVRREGWRPEHYAIIERVELETMPYGKAFGFAVKYAAYSNYYDYSDKWCKTGLIPCCGCYQWHLVPEADLAIQRNPVIQRATADERLKVASSVLRFGKFKGCTLAHVFEQQPTYLSWLIENIEPFILDRATMIAFEEGPFKFPPEIKALNERKFNALEN